ncbi:MAG: TIM barrel protein [Candidatus Woesearchaeota archaeon]
MTMKIGLKWYTGNPIKLVRKFVKHTDFMEIMPVPGTDYRRYKQLGQVTIVHIPHIRFGYNPSNPEREKKTMQLVQHSIEAADYYGAEKIIAHPGLMENKGCILENTIDFFSSIKDKRLLIENMHLNSAYGTPFLGAMPEDIKRVMKKTGMGFCLDFAHAAATSAKIKIPVLDVVKDFMKLKPKHFHICGGYLHRTRDTHSHLGDGNFPLEEFKKTIGKGWVSVETPHDTVERQMKDIEFLRK